MKITREDFGIVSNGRMAHLYRMTNEDGAYITVTDFGCRIVSICVPDKDGNLRDVVMGYDTPLEYESVDSYFGAMIGRVGNRIGKGHFELNGKEYQLAINNGPNSLHGGLKGFHQYLWDAEQLPNALKFTRTSPDGEENYPGNLSCSVTYTWSGDNELGITYEAVSDQDTLYNPTNHSYFNLDGDASGSVLNQELMIKADRITEADADVLVTGQFMDVEATPFDFRKAKSIGRDLPSDHPQLKYTIAYDHNYVLSTKGFSEAAALYSPDSGIRMTVFTDQPGMQLFIPAVPVTDHGKSGHVYPAYSCVCLETQHFPDAINHPDFPSIVLKAGETYHSQTIYHFSVVTNKR